MTWLADNISLGALTSVISACVSISAAATAIVFTRSKERRERFEIQMRYFGEVRKWAEAGADAMTEAIHLCDLDPEQTNDEPFLDRRHRLRIAMSGLIDKGRWFFPNIPVQGVGTDKEAGYQGLRHSVLDGLVDGYHALGGLSADHSTSTASRAKLTAAKRLFVSEVQMLLDPYTQQAEFKLITQRRTPKHAE